MDFTFDDDQQALIEAVTTMFAKQAGNERARSIGHDGHDDALLEALSGGGFLDVWHDDTIGPLGAALIAELASRYNARANIAIRMLVAPALLGLGAPDRIAVTTRNSRGPVRFGQHAAALIVLDGDVAFATDITRATPVDSRFGYPYAHVETGAQRSLGPGSGVVLADWWRVALAVEIAGALRGAVDHTVGYLAQRTQFGKPLGSLQALQHRLAEAHVLAEGTKWLARRAAYERADPRYGATAAAHAAHAAQVIGTEMHQMSGAIGFTTEFDLQLWTTRLHGLRLEFGGAAGHQLATTAAHWG